MSMAHKSQKSQGGGNSSKVSNCIASLFVAMLVATLSFTVSAADYYWTGGGNDGGMWSNPANWATDAQGTPATAAPVTRSSYHFDVPDGGLVVTQDIITGFLVSNITVTTSATGPVELKLVSSAENAYLDFTSATAVTVPADVTFTLNVAMGGQWTNADFSKFGEGDIVFDLMHSPQTSRGFVINEGRAFVASTSADPRFLVKMGGRDPDNLPVLENQLENGLYGSLWAMRLGNIKLNGMKIKVGDASDVGAAYVIPPVVDAGAISFGNERSVILSELSPKYSIGIDRAILHSSDAQMVAAMTFNDAADPTRDELGYGSRLVPFGSPSVANDGVRGNVLSLDGSSGYKGPDENTGFAEFDPAHGFTLAMWLKPASDCNKTARIFFFGNGSGGGSSVAVRLNNDSQGNILVGVWGSQTYIPAADVHDGNWHHLAVTFDGKEYYTTFEIFYDGNLVKTWSPWVVVDPPNRDFYLGRVSAAQGWTGGANPYKGLIDDFLLGNRPFAQQEILDLYTKGASALGGTPAFGDVSISSVGTLAVGASASVKTLSGTAVVGGVEVGKSGGSLTVGTGAGSAIGEFKGTIEGADTTLVKEGTDYALELSGSADAVTNVVVSEGELVLRRPTKTRRGLVAYYSFDDDDPGRDSSVIDTHLVETNLTPTTLSKVADGVSGSALHFPGQTSLQSQGVLPSSFPVGNSSYTISFWIKPTEEAVNGTWPVCCWGANNNYLISMIRFNGAGSMQFGNWNEDMPVTGLTLTDGNWHHVVAVYDAANTTKRFYFDGVQKGIKTTVHELSISSANPIQIGHCSVSGRETQFYTGDLDEFMVFNYPWSADEVTAEYNRSAAIDFVSASDALPTPVARWTFDDNANPGADTTSNEALTLVETNGTVPLESGDAICGKAARFSTTSGFFKLSEFPSSIIPSGDSAFTVVVRYRADDVQASGYYCSMVRWGDTDKWGSGGMFTLGTGAQGSDTLRVTMMGTHTPEGFHRTKMGTDRTRWLTAAIVVGARSSTKRSMTFYADGEAVMSKTGAWCPDTLTAENFLIGSSLADDRDYYGLVDDVQIYDMALSAGQVRMITEQLEASKGKAVTGTAIPSGVLTAQPDVTVAQGAKLRVASTESIGTLSGSGAVEIAPLASLTVNSALSAFDGTVSGDGPLAIADGATIDFGGGSVPAFNVSCPLALGENVTMNTTVVSGNFLLARASSFVGVENLESWTATVGNRRYRFVVSADGTSLYLRIDTGLHIIVR